MVIESAYVGSIMDSVVNKNTIELELVIVPISASGLRGQKPLVIRVNVGKGSRQIRSVTLGKGLAPVER